MLAERAKQWPEQWKQVGEENHARQVAQKMLERTAMDGQMISELSGLDIEQVRKLREELQH